MCIAVTVERRYTGCLSTDRILPLNLNIYFSFVKIMLRNGYRGCDRLIIITILFNIRTTVIDCYHRIGKVQNKLIGKCIFLRVSRKILTFYRKCIIIIFCKGYLTGISGFIRNFNIITVCPFSNGCLMSSYTVDSDRHIFRVKISLFNRYRCCSCMVIILCSRLIIIGYRNFRFHIINFQWCIINYF